MKRIAYFISPHGFGHAARAAAVMEAIREIDNSFCFEIFTATPAWFFQDNLSNSFNYHFAPIDLGLVQKTPFEEDIDETLHRLNQLLPYANSEITKMAHKIRRLKCRLALCDIAPLGLLAAKNSGIPSVLIENFTWDWIYAGYVDRYEQIAMHSSYLRQVYDRADVHIQVQPVCHPKSVDFLAGPVSRKFKTSRADVRQKLGLSGNSKLALITSGGVPHEYAFTERLFTESNIHFVVPGGGQSSEFRDNLILLPHHSEFFHPDLVNAADAVIGKAGYSTLAEAYRAGVPFGYVSRPHNRESAALAAFIEDEMPALAIAESEFQSGDWLFQLRHLMDMPRIERNAPNGADEIARFILNLLK